MPPPSASPRRSSALLLWALAAGLAAPEPSRAMCDVIPSPTDFFRGALGSITTPALIPGLSVDVIVRSVVCDQDTRSAAPDFLGAGGAALTAADLSVAILFQPLDPTAPRNGLWLRPSCAGVGPIAIPGPGAEGSVTCLDGADADYEVVSVDLGDGTMQDRLRLVFPDTDALVDAPADGLGLAGPAKVAVLLADAPFPTALATTLCADFTGALVSCADFLYKRDSTCRTAPDSVEPSAIHVTALPRPNDFADLCVAETADSPCNLAPGATGPPLLFTTDVEGNALVPMDYTDVLVRVLGEPFPQLVSGALEAAGSIIELPSANFLESRAPNWALLPPLFGPASDLEAVGELFGSVDARIGVHIARRRSPNFQQCSGGARAGLPCFDGEDCPAPGACVPGTCTGNAAVVCAGDLACAGAGECGPSNFDLSSAAAGEGCSSIPGACPAAFPCTTQGAVRLEVVASGSTDDRAINTPVNECVVEAAALAGGLPLPPSLNVGFDLRDEVVQLIDRTTFDAQKIGQEGAVARSVTRIQDGLFTFDSSMVEGERLVHLESEFQEGCSFSTTCDRNANGLISDDFMRAYQLGPPGSEFAIDLMSTAVITPLVSPPTLPVAGATTADGLLLAVEAEPRIDNRPIRISEGKVFVRVDPLDNVLHELTRTARASDNGGPGALGNDDVFDARVSHHGDFVIFSTSSDNLLGSEGDENGRDDVFLRDRAPTAETRRVSIPSCAQQASEELEGNDDSNDGDVSADGRWAVFESRATNLVPGDTNSRTDIFLRDMWATCPDEILFLLTPGLGGVPADGSSFDPRISADGRFVVWSSFASNLVPGDGNFSSDIFLLDRDTDGDGDFGDLTLTRIPTPLGASDPDVAETGATAYADGGEGPANVLLTENGTTLSLNGPSSEAFGPSISADGRFVAFQLRTFSPSFQENTVVFDRETGNVRLALSATAPRECFELGFETVPNSWQADISGDGRFLAVTTDRDLVQDDADSEDDLYREDLLSGAISFLSDVGSSGFVEEPSISSRGNMVSFIGPTGMELDTAWLSAPDVETGGVVETGAFLGVMDTEVTPPEIYVFDLPADFAAVSHGRAVVAAEDENVQLFRHACTGDVSISCRTDADCGPAGPCIPRVEDLLRPSVVGPGQLAIDENFACAVTDDGDGPVVACHEIGTPPSSSLDDVLDANGQPVIADSIQIFDGKLAVKVPAGGGRFVLFTADLEGGGPLVPHDFVEDFVLGEVVCFTRPEPVLDAEGRPCDLDNDGDCNNDVMTIVAFPGDPTAQLLNCDRLSVACDQGACNPGEPHSVIGRTCKFIIDEELVGVDGVGTPGLGGDLNELEALIGRCVPNDQGTAADTDIGSPVDLDSSENPVEQGEGGDTDVDQTGLCIDDATGAATTPCLTSAECGNNQTCSTDLFPVTLASSDRDGDGWLDTDDNCPDTPNAGQENFDAAAELPEVVGDACDPFSCGDGIVQSAEECDLGAANGGPRCTADCALPPLACPCFGPEDLVAPISLCLEFGPWSGFYTVNYSNAPGGYFADVRQNYCRYVAPPGPLVGSILTPQEFLDCRQLLLNAQQDQGASCIVF